MPIKIKQTLLYNRREKQNLRTVNERTLWKGKFSNGKKMQLKLFLANHKHNKKSKVVRKLPIRAWARGWQGLPPQWAPTQPAGLLSASVGSAVPRDKTQENPASLQQDDLSTDYILI